MTTKVSTELEAAIDGDRTEILRTAAAAKTIDKSADFNELAIAVSGVSIQLAEALSDLTPTNVDAEEINALAELAMAGRILAGQLADKSGDL